LKDVYQMGKFHCKMPTCMPDRSGCMSGSSARELRRLDVDLPADRFAFPQEIKSLLKKTTE